MVGTPALPPWLAKIYPFAPHSWATPSGARMSYLDEGPRNDEAVLLLHGNPTWSFYYRNLIQSLSPTVRCVAPDHIGMGLSEKPASYEYRLARRVADIEALVRHLGLRRVHLVLHDWGGAIGLGWGTGHPDAVGRIALMNTAAFPSLRIPGRIALCRAPLVGELLVRGLNGFAGPATTLAMSEHALGRDERRGYLFPYDSWANRIGVHRFVRDIPLELDHPSRPEIERIARELPRLARQPKLIAWGGRDFCFNDHFLSRWRELFPHAQVHRYPNAGHYVLEDAAPDVRVRIRDFLLSST